MQVVGQKEGDQFWVEVDEDERAKAPVNHLIVGVGRREVFVGPAPLLRLIVALIFAAPAAIAGYALVHGVTREAVPSEIWPQIFCIIGGALVVVSSLMRLAAPMATRST